MSYTIFDRMCDAVADALCDGLNPEKVEAIWEAEVDQILYDFADAERQLWDKVGEVIARHSNEVD